MAHQIARTQLRAWMEQELATEFGVNRRGLRPSLQIGFKPDRPSPDASLKWNRITTGTTDPLQIEEATVCYPRGHIPKWGNNRSPNNDYTAGSTLSTGFKSPSKTVYFDHLAGVENVPLANEAFTGLAPGCKDIAAWIYLSNEHVVKPGLVVNFQNERNQSINGANLASLVRAGYQVSVVPYNWWSPFLSEAYKAEAIMVSSFIENKDRCSLKSFISLSSGVAHLGR